MGRRIRDYHGDVILLLLRYTVQPDVRVTLCWLRLYRMSGPSDRDEKKNNNNNKKKPMVILKLGTPLGRPS